MSESVTTTQSPTDRHGIGYRHLQVFFIFLCLSLCIVMRVNFSIAIVAMTNENGTTNNPDIPIYNWDNNSVILSSFFWGYILLQIVTGYLSKIYGAKYVLLINFFANTIAFLLIPYIAEETGSYGVMFLRVVQGLGQGCVLPCAHTVLGKWAPAGERTFMGILVYSGLSFGAIISLSVTGYLCSSWIGWPSSFYIFGSVGLIWCIGYVFFGASSPATFKYISPNERNYIETSLGQSNDEIDPPIPWKSILTSVPFWAVVSGNIGSAWGYTVLMTQVPSYFAYVMKFNIESNGFISSIPYLTSFLCGLMVATIADIIIAKDLLSRLNVRRSFQIFGAYGVALCLMLLGYAAKTQTIAVVYLAIANAFYACTLVGYAVNHVDLSPRFAGCMQGISNTIGQAVAIFGPLSVQWIVRDKQNADHWRIVFLLVSLFYLVTATVYALFTSTTRQEWDFPLETDRDRIPPKQSILSLFVNEGSDIY